MDELREAIKGAAERGLELSGRPAFALSPEHFVITGASQNYRRAAVGYRYCWVGLEHLRALLLLAQQGALVSCMALFRPMIEAHVRGLWLCAHASDTDIVKLAKRQSRFEFPAFHELLKTVSGGIGPTHPGASLLRSVSWRQLCDYTHGGMRLIEDTLHLDDSNEKVAGEIFEALRKAVVAGSFCVLLFAQKVTAAETQSSVKTALREYLEGTGSSGRHVSKLRKMFSDAGLKQRFEEEIEWYQLRRDFRWKEKTYDYSEE